MLHGIDTQPISQIVWLKVDDLDANSWNPNVVVTPEFRLLRTSLLKSGWMQPILVGTEGARHVIIDGFHRATLAKTDKDVRKMTDGLVPCAVLALSQAERMMLTVRINRAKGSHVALKMHELVKTLVEDLHIPVEQVCEGIGATQHEVSTLLTENLFKKFNVDTAQYSKAWVPKQ